MEEPKLHLWDTGIARITRHPQMVGQLLWCFAHTLYIGTSFMCATSALLCGILCRCRYVYCVSLITILLSSQLTTSLLCGMETDD